MSTDDDFPSKVAGTFIMAGLLLSMIHLSFIPILVVFYIIYFLAWLFDGGSTVRQDRDVLCSTVRAIERPPPIKSPSAKVILCKNEGLWVEVYDQVYHIPFAQYPALAKASIAEVCEIELMDGGHLYWPASRQVVELAAIKNCRPARPVMLQG